MQKGGEEIGTEDHGDVWAMPRRLREDSGFGSQEYELSESADQEEEE